MICVICEIYKNYTVYACGKDEVDIEDIRRMWEFDAFPVIFCHEITEGDVKDVLEVVDKFCSERAMIGFLGTHYFITDNENISRELEKKGFEKRKYNSIKEMYQVIK